MTTRLSFADKWPFFSNSIILLFRLSSSASKALPSKASPQQANNSSFSSPCSTRYSYNDFQSVSSTFKSCFNTLVLSGLFFSIIEEYLFFQILFMSLSEL
ncbi:hypothetical protein BD560DRAFT_415901 [Blakeslea trispora]|nr:hypothetical protein BD560DRAFT_415901 [Blakeslea trispora]